MNKIKVNGVEIEYPDGASVSITNGEVKVVKANEQPTAVDSKGDVYKLDEGNVSCRNW
jgi:hypothetical protein